MADGSSIPALRRDRIFLGSPGWILIAAILIGDVLRLMTSQSAIARVELVSQVRP